MYERLLFDNACLRPVPVQLFGKHHMRPVQVRIPYATFIRHLPTSYQQHPSACSSLSPTSVWFVLTSVSAMHTCMQLLSFPLQFTHMDVEAGRVCLVYTIDWGAYVEDGALLPCASSEYVCMLKTLRQVPVSTTFYVDFELRADVDMQQQMQVQMQVQQQQQVQQVQVQMQQVQVQMHVQMQQRQMQKTLHVMSPSVLNHEAMCHESRADHALTLLQPFLSSARTVTMMYTGWMHTDDSMRLAKQEREVHRRQELRLRRLLDSAVNVSARAIKLVADYVYDRRTVSDGYPTSYRMNHVLTGAEDYKQISRSISDYIREQRHHSMRVDVVAWTPLRIVCDAPEGALHVSLCTL
jgi:hypothetical protein